MDKILVEVSVGELMDKISILDIKKDKIKDRKNLEHIENEYKILTKEYDNKVKIDNKLKDLSKIYNNCNPDIKNCSNNKDFVIKKAYGKMILIRIKN